MVGNLIYDQFLTARDWPFGAALSLILIVIMMLLLFVQALAVNRRHAARGGGPMPERLGAGLRACICGWFYAFLYLPILVLMGLTFNRAGLPTAWTGFSLEWYGKLLASPQIVSSAASTR